MNKKPLRGSFMLKSVILRERLLYGNLELLSTHESQDLKKKLWKR